MTSIVSGGGSTADFQTFDDATLQQSTSTLEQKTTDSMSSIAPTHSLGDSYIEAYLNPPGKVELPLPTNMEFDQSVLLNGLQNAKQTISNASQAAQQSIINSANEQAVFFGAAKDQLDKLTPEQLRSIAYQPGMSDDAVKEEVMYAVLHPDADVPDNVREIANQIFAGAVAGAQKTLGADWSPTLTIAMAQDAAIMMTMQNVFDDVIADTKGLSDKDKAKLHFAMEHPDAVDSLPDNLKEKFNEIMGKVHTRVQALCGIPDGWQFPEDNNSPVGLTAQFDQKFEKALQGLVDDGKVTEQEAQQLETLHYNLNADIPNKDELMDKLNKIEKPILNGLAKVWGFPDDYRPQTGTTDRDAMVNLMYQGIFNQALNNYKPPLSDEQKDLIRQSQGPLGMGSLSPQLKAIAEQIKAHAVEKTIGKYGLTADWQPRVLEVASPESLMPNHALLKGMLKFANDMLKAGEKTVQQVPNGEMKNTYMVFLSMVATMLAKLSVTLTQSQVVEADIGKVLTQMRLDTQINKIEKQRRQMEEMRKQQEAGQKGGFLGFIMNALNWIINIVLVVCTFGAALGLIIDAAIEGKDMASFNMITFAFEKAGQIFGKPLGTWLLMIMYVALLIVSTIVGIFFAFVTGGMSMMLAVALLSVILVDIYVGNGDIFTQFFMAIGIPEVAATMISMVLCMIISVIIDVIISILIEVFTAGAGTEVTIALWAAKVALYTAKIAKAVMTAVMTAIRVITTVCKVVGRILEIMVKLIEGLVKLAVEVAKAILNAMKNIIERMAGMLEKFGSVVGKAADSLTSSIEGKIVEALAKAGIKEAAKELAIRGSEKLSELAAKQGIKQCIETAERIGLDKAGKFALKFAKKELKEFFSGWDIAKEMRQTADDLTDMRNMLKNLGDVQHHEAKVEKIKELQETMKLIKDTEKKMKTAEGAVQYEKDYQGLQEHLTKVLKGYRDDEGNIVELGIDHYDQGLTGKDLSFEKLSEPEKQRRLRDIENKIDARIERGDTLGAKVRAWNDVNKTEREFNLARDNYKALKEIGTSDMTPTEKAQHAADLKAAKGEVKAAEAASDKALDRHQEIFDVNWGDYVLRAKNTTQQAFGALQGIQGIQNNILEGKIAMLQAEMEAYATEMDYIIKMLNQTIQRLMQSVTELGTDISNISKLIKQLYRSNSQTMTALSMAA